MIHRSPRRLLSIRRVVYGIETCCENDNTNGLQHCIDKTGPKVVIHLVGVNNRDMISISVTEKLGYTTMIGPSISRLANGNQFTIAV
jgi:hypothetical protein